jgi:hypothetical protein
MEKPKNNYQKLHPTHLAALREYIERHGAAETERRLGLATNGLRNARRGLGIFPSTQAKILALIGSPAPPPPSRDLTKLASSFKELGAATALVLEVLAGVEPANRSRVLDMARAAL